MPVYVAERMGFEAIQAVSEKGSQVAPDAAMTECGSAPRDGRFGSLTGRDYLVVTSIEFSAYTQLLRFRIFLGHSRALQ